MHLVRLQLRNHSQKLFSSRFTRAIGGRAPQFSDIETYKKVQVDYTLAAATAFREHLAPLLPEGKKFHFVFCSGKLAEWDQQKSLRFMADTRHVKVYGLLDSTYIHCSTC